MMQLMMKRLEKRCYDVCLPSGYSLKTFSPGMEGDWAKACYELNGNRLFSSEQFRKLMTEDPCVQPERIFFAVSPQGEGVSTATAHYDAATGIGTLHMVGTRSDYKGLGLGYAVCAAAVNAFEALAVSESNLLTDDFRIPAIKIYFKLGYMPLLPLHVPDGEPSTHERWAKIASVLGLAELRCIEEASGKISIIKAS